MIKVGFIAPVSQEWMGGLNYFKNLLFAISSLKNKEIEPIVFIGKKVKKDVKEMYSQYAKVIEHSMFDRNSFQWYMWKFLYNKFETTYVLEQLLIKEKIDILSHSNIVGLNICKTINWIPDFQHIYLPEMFSKKEIRKRNNDFMNMIRKSDMIVLSSYDALKDLNSFSCTEKNKVRVLQFVSQVNIVSEKKVDQNKELLQKKYLLPDNFFYLPNQFWKHKNHMLVFEAVRELKKKGKDIYVVCTGYLHDYRNTNYVKQIKEFISKNELENNIRLLGLVNYEDVFLLIKFSIAVINPSLFEGWSSTVEECKSMGKNMILSNLGVHKEQYPEALFFEKNNVNSLTEVLSNDTTLMHFNCTKYQNNIENRTKLFGENFQRIVLEVFYNNVV